MSADRPQPRAVIGLNELERRKRDLRGKTRRQLRTIAALAESRLAATREGYERLLRYNENIERRLRDVHAHPSTDPATVTTLAGFPPGVIRLPAADSVPEELLEAVRSLAGSFGSTTVLAAAVTIQADQ